MQLRQLSMLIIGLVLGYGLAILSWADVHQQLFAVQHQIAEPAPTPPPSERSTAPLRSSGREIFQANARGHVEAHADIDGREMVVLVDTGASSVVLRQSDARRAGHRPHHSDFTVPVSTANGQAFFAAITLREVEVGSIRVRNVRALVGRDEDLGQNLLGMSFLRELESFRFEGQYLVLEN